MASTAQYKCKACGETFTARTADRKRGWARCCSKSCAALVSNAKTGKYEKHLFVKHEGSHHAAMSANEDGWDGHKNQF